MPRKPRTKQQQDKATDERLRRTYGLSLDEYEGMLLAQDSHCAVCPQPPINRRLHVDHDHAWKKVKIHVERYQDGWSAWAQQDKVYFAGHWRQRRAEAVTTVRTDLLRQSVRGLLCHHCNAGLKKFSDDPQRLIAAATYLTRFQNGY